MQIAIEGIQKSFGETSVLKGVYLHITNGEFVSLVGPSGCGKSTLLRIIAGLEQPDAGEISIGDEPVTQKRAADRNLSMVFQSYALYPHLTVRENIGVPLTQRQLTTSQRLPLIGPFLPGSTKIRMRIAQQVQQAAEMLHIEHLLDRKPGQLSGGQRQRVAVGRALVRKPAAFLLDEPLSNLDAKLRVHTRAEIAQLHRDLQATFIYVTHDQAEAMTMSDRIAVMMDGELLQVDTPDAIYMQPVDLRVAEFIGLPKIATFAARRDRSGRVLIANQYQGLTSNGPEGLLTVAVRPEALKLVPAEIGISGTVKHIENLGSEAFLHITLVHDQAVVVIRVSTTRSRTISIGERIGLAFETADAHLFDSSGRRVAAETQELPSLKVAANG